MVVTLSRVQNRPGAALALDVKQHEVQTRIISEAREYLKGRNASASNTLMSNDWEVYMMHGRQIMLNGTKNDAHNPTTTNWGVAVDMTTV